MCDLPQACQGGLAIDDLECDERMKRVLKDRMQLKALTRIQAMTYSVILGEGRKLLPDVLIRAETGSGKTLAYVIPIVESLIRLQREGVRLERSDGTRVIILVPTRELVPQVEAVVRDVTFRYPYLVTAPLLGGQKRDSEKARLRSGAAIVVATPGRLLDHLEHTASFKTSKLQTLVFDEADRLLDMGFEKPIRSILEHLTRACKAQAAADEVRGDSIVAGEAKSETKSGKGKDDAKGEAKGRGDKKGGSGGETETAAEGGGEGAGDPAVQKKGRSRSKASRPLFTTSSGGKRTADAAKVGGGDGGEGSGEDADGADPSVPVQRRAPASGVFSTVDVSELPARRRDGVPQVVLASATLTKEVERLSHLVLRDAVRVDVKAKWDVRVPGSKLGADQEEGEEGGVRGAGGADGGAEGESAKAGKVAKLSTETEAGEGVNGEGVEGGVDAGPVSAATDDGAQRDETGFVVFPTNLVQHVLEAPLRQRLAVLVALLRMCVGIDRGLPSACVAAGVRTGRVMVFVNTRAEVEFLASVLSVVEVAPRCRNDAEAAAAKRRAAGAAAIAAALKKGGKVRKGRMRTDDIPRFALLPNCDVLRMHGDLSFAERLGVLNRFSSRTGVGAADDEEAGGDAPQKRSRTFAGRGGASVKSAVVVCTDVAARGLDFPDVDFVIHYDPPVDASSYVHRAGRAARFNRPGCSILFTAQGDVAPSLLVAAAIEEAAKPDVALPGRRRQRASRAVRVAQAMERLLADIPASVKSSLVGLEGPTGVVPGLLRYGVNPALLLPLTVQAAAFRMADALGNLRSVEETLGHLQAELCARIDERPQKADGTEYPGVPQLQQLAAAAYLSWLRSLRTRRGRTLLEGLLTTPKEQLQSTAAAAATMPNAEEGVAGGAMGEGAAPGGEQNPLAVEGEGERLEGEGAVAAASDVRDRRWADDRSSARPYARHTYEQREDTLNITAAQAAQYLAVAISGRDFHLPHGVVDKALRVLQPLHLGRAAGSFGLKASPSDIPRIASTIPIETRVMQNANAGVFRGTVDEALQKAGGGGSEEREGAEGKGEYGDDADQGVAEEADAVMKARVAIAESVGPYTVAVDRSERKVGTLISRRMAGRRRNLAVSPSAAATRAAVGADEAQKKTDGSTAKRMRENAATMATSVSEFAAM